MQGSSVVPCTMPKLNACCLCCMYALQQRKQAPLPQVPEDWEYPAPDRCQIVVEPTGLWLPSKLSHYRAPSPSSGPARLRRPANCCTAPYQVKALTAKWFCRCHSGSVTPPAKPKRIGRQGLGDATSCNAHAPPATVLLCFAVYMGYTTQTSVKP